MKKYLPLLAALLILPIFALAQIGPGTGSLIKLVGTVITPADPAWTFVGGDGATYTPQGVTTVTVGGITVGTDLGLIDVPIQDILDDMLYAYVPPTVSLVLSPVISTIREFGNPVASVDMNATTVKHSDPITSVTFWRSGALIHTQAVPIPGGGLETYTDTTDVDTNGVTFQAKAGDGTTIAVSTLPQYVFVFPYYYGIGDVGTCADEAKIKALTKSIRVNTANVSVTTSPTNQVYVFAYPASYASLTSILDTNNFETLSDYTLTTTSVTGLDLTPQSYKCYENVNLTTQVNFVNKYIHP